SIELWRIWQDPIDTAGLLGCNASAPTSSPRQVHITASRGYWQRLWSKIDASGCGFHGKETPLEVGLRVRTWRKSRSTLIASRDHESGYRQTIAWNPARSSVWKSRVISKRLHLLSWDMSWARPRLPAADGPSNATSLKSCVSRTFHLSGK